MGASRKRERAYHARSTTPGLSFEPSIGQTAGYLLGIEMGQSATTAVVVRECLEAYDKLLIASCTATTPEFEACAQGISMKPTISLAQYLSICNNDTFGRVHKWRARTEPNENLTRAINRGNWAATDLSVPLRQIEDSEERKQV